jgi:ATP-dependent protease Clp ATPase subunit
MPSLLYRMIGPRLQRTAAPRTAELISYAAEIEVHASRVEMAAKQIWEIRQELNRHLAAAAPGSELETRLREIMFNVPSVERAVTLGAEARALKELATQMVAECKAHPMQTLTAPAQVSA